MTTPERRSLRDIVASGQATDDELAEFFGADLMNEVAANFRGVANTEHEFYVWFAFVLEPIGVDPKAALAMFTGRATIEEFVESLDDATQERFLDMYEPLQDSYQASIDGTSSTAATTSEHIAWGDFR